MLLINLQDLIYNT